MPPCALVWTPIPFVTWIFPFVGHVGITSSRGKVRDFLGPFFVNDSGSLGFGAPTRTLRLDPALVTKRPASPHVATGRDANSPPSTSDFEAWDAAMLRATKCYERQWYRFLTNNCHCYVAHCLNQMEYKGSSDHNMASIAAMVVLRARHVGVVGLLKTWLPWAVIMVLCGYFGTWVFFLIWVSLAVTLGLGLTIYAVSHVEPPLPKARELRVLGQPRPHSRHRMGPQESPCIPPARPQEWEARQWLPQRGQTSDV